MSCRVYLGRLPYGTRERDVEKFFRGFGKLREVNLKNGYGFVVRCLDPFSFLFDWFLISESGSFAAHLGNNCIAVFKWDFTHLHKHFNC